MSDILVFLRKKIIEQVAAAMKNGHEIVWDYDGEDYSWTDRVTGLDWSISSSGAGIVYWDSIEESDVRLRVYWEFIANKKSALETLDALHRIESLKAFW